MAANPSMWNHSLLRSWGHAFRPDPDECILYLTCKVTSKPLPCHGAILDLDPYNPNQLPQIFSSVKKLEPRENALYLFTKLHTNGGMGNHPIVNRQVGNGFWRTDQTVGDDQVIDKQGNCIGMSRNFTYLEKDSNFDGRIQMTEYTLPVGTSLIQYDPLKDYVLCKIFRKGRWHKKFLPEPHVTAVVEQSKPDDPHPDLASPCPTTSSSSRSSSPVSSPSHSSDSEYKSQSASLVAGQDNED